MDAYKPSCSNWRSPSSQQYLSSSSEDDDGYDAHDYDEEEEEEEYDEETGWEGEEYDEEEGCEEWEDYDEEEGCEEEEEYDEEEGCEGEDYDEEEGCEEEEEYDGEDEYWDDDDEYDEEEELCYEEEEEPYQVSVAHSHKPSTWMDMPLDKEVELVQLPTNSPEYLKVKSKVHSTLPVHIDRIVRIQNPYIWGCYTLKKNEYEHRLGSAVKELELFHATAQSNVDSIAANNLDWRRTKRAKFGKGVSFSPRAHYANKYCNYNAGTERALILTRVLVGKCHKGKYWMKSPKEGYDTTIGNSKSVYVKYEDNEFYPEYVAYYRQ
ncbi:hypothetical protein B7P43_G12171 [Cryptotermes secundus]|uniref:Poly [ADP-ribose] polymerase n=1 Tax=Cryptotermes secundus TaxID=105785 RepID=A0A2J7QT04_9NEOP|nr:protein mono-ADP-ribosyltransferase PARP12 [Cryptotermes secundus]XP_023709491.1 protein mono-ADP-ribosyltransferase PARP12 [Cryptotermes secundus]XP_023709492.1 protein mono-ADP-ribosyltransferase PARP12 [Cryptotermes secundus]XP_023709493.1 protein mono-ADP-ribosyltransferase PARP12 [Cryptotermes secundus]PNF31721.1 hypothetical protein B7P43_G12171 [Cryptotermes secundus]